MYSISTVLEQADLKEPTLCITAETMFLAGVLGNKSTPPDQLESMSR